MDTFYAVFTIKQKLGILMIKSRSSPELYRMFALLELEILKENNYISYFSNIIDACRVTV